LSERMIPLLVSPNGLRILVFGGGAVALRKCRYFEGSDITVVAESFLPEMKDAAGTLIKESIPGDPGPMMAPYDIAVAATDNKEINDRICGCARALGKPVNSAHGGGTLLIPSVLRRRDYVVAVSTEGKVPAFPPFLVGELDRMLGPGYDRIMDLLKELRRISKEQIPRQEDRQAFLERVLTDGNILNAASEGRMSDALAAAMRSGGLQ